MKRKVAKNVLSFILLITTLMVSTVSFAAGPNTDQIQWSYIHAVENYVDNVSTFFTKKIELYASTEVYTGHYSSVTAQLEKLNSNGDWENVSGYYYADYEEGTVSIINEPAITGLSSGTYRFYLVHRAYSQSWLRLETVTTYTDEVTL